MPHETGVDGQAFAVVTLHRPSNVDSREVLAELLEGLAEVARVMPVLFPIHPRTRQRILDFGLESLVGGVRLLAPLGYIETVSLVDQAAVVLTDSGGLQEETTMLGVPCLTLRPNTERPVTITEGTNRLIESSRAALVTAFGEVFRRRHDGAAVAAYYATGLTLASLVGLCRILSGKHYLTDVLVGAVVGISVGVLVPALHARSPERP